MSSFVLDASAILSCFLDDEASAYAESIQAVVQSNEALVPAIWPLEITNAVLAAEKRGRLTRAEADRVLSLMADIPVSIVPFDLASAGADTITIARDNTLSVYDATYLQLADSRRLPLATLDKRL